MEFKKFKALLKSLKNDDMVYIMSCEKEDDNYLIINCQSGTYIKVQLPCIIPDSGHYWLSMEDIKKIFNLLEDYPIHIKIKTGDKISIDGYTINILPDENLPVFKMPERADNYISGYKYSVLKPYMYTANDYRYCDIAQVLFSGNHIYSTDSKRMIRHKIQSDVEQDFTIPDLVAKNLPGEFGVHIDKDNNITLVIHNVRIQFFNHVASYPDVKKIIESLNHDYTITVDTKELLKNINKVKKLKEKYINLFSDTKNELLISTFEPGHGIEYEKAINGDVHKPINISFNTKYLYDLINTFKKEKEVTVKYVNTWKPIHMETNDILSILMPVRNPSK